MVALRVLVQSYIAAPAEPLRVDWRWLERRTMREKSTWREEDRARNVLSVQALAAAGLGLDGTRLEPGEDGPSPAETEVAEMDETL